MYIRDAKESDVKVLNEMLNEFLSFGLSTEDNVLKDIQNLKTIFKVLILNENIIGLISATNVHSEDILSLNELGYTDVAIKFIQDKIKNKEILSFNHAVILPEYRNNKCLKSLIKSCMDKDSIFCAISWVRDKSLIDSVQKSREHYLVIEKYWADLKLNCDICSKFCECSVIIQLEFNIDNI